MWRWARSHVSVLGRGRRTWAVAVAFLFSLALASLAVDLRVADPAAKGPKARFAGPTASQPLALSGDDRLLAVVNPDDDSVTVIRVSHERNFKITEVAVQREPNGVAFLPDGRKLYVANTVSGTVSVMKVHGTHVFPPHLHIPVGTEPYGLAMTPNGTKLYVTNARSHDISVIDTETDAVVRTIRNVGVEPRGIAVTNNGDGDDLDETVYVTQFLALPIPGRIDGADDAKKGLVTVIRTSDDTVVGSVDLNPIADTGFKAAGDALARIPPGPAFVFTTGAYPNQLNNIAVRGNFAYVPNTGASPNGPVRFNVNTQSLLHVIDRLTGEDAGKTINMHLAVAQQSNPARLFITQPWTMAFKHGPDEGYVVSAASNIVVKVAVDPVTGQPTVQNDPSDPTRVLQIQVGKNPRGIVVNSTDTRAYVMNFVSRDVSVIDLTASPEREVARIPAATLPPPGSLAEDIHIGKELYHTSVGEFDAAPGTSTPIRGRMSQAGWGACSTCHPFGLSDNVVWIFAAGPRRAISQHTDFDPTDPTRQIQRALNWSAIFDEQQDFELNIRGVSGGLGIFVQADGVTPDNMPPVAAFDPANGPPNTTRRQLTVQGVPAWDAIKAFVQFGIRPPISPVPETDPDVRLGRSLFISANCQLCHGGPQWTSSRVRYTPPPGPGVIVNGQIIGELKQVGTFDPTSFNEVRANAAPPLGAAGFTPASLLSIHAFPQTFLHNGAASSLDEVLDNVAHRSAGTGGVDTLANPADRARLVKFLLSIDAATEPIPVP